MFSDVDTPFGTEGAGRESPRALLRPAIMTSPILAGAISSSFSVAVVRVRVTVLASDSEAPASYVEQHMRRNDAGTAPIMH
jgi:hypothetical protein